MFPWVRHWVVLFSTRLPWIGNDMSIAEELARTLPGFTSLLWIGLALVPGTLFFLEIFGAYKPLFQQSRTRICLSSLLAPFVGLSLVTLTLYAVKSPGWSRIFVFSFTIFSGLFLTGYRLLFYYYFKRRGQAGIYARNTLLIGSTPAVEWLTDYFAQNVPSSEYRLAGYLEIASVQTAPFLNSESVVQSKQLTCLGQAYDLGELLVNHPIRDVIAIQPVTNSDWLNKVIKDCDYFRVTLRIVPEALLQDNLCDLQLMYRNEPLNLPAVVLAPRFLDSEALFIKRIFDIIVSTTLLILLAPVFAIIAIAIKISTPNLSVFYPWKVVGKNGIEFTGYKFTTMAADADQRKADLQSRNEMTGPVFKLKDDPRVTRLGHFLRKYSLNELPQLWSVLKGDMSLVGPRPAFRHELERYEFWHKRKLSIRPGITCMWQVRGRNQISNFDDWVKMDLEYIDNWSLWLDIKILFWTAWAVIGGTGW